MGCVPLLCPPPTPHVVFKLPPAHSYSTPPPPPNTHTFIVTVGWSSLCSNTWKDSVRLSPNVTLTPSRLCNELLAEIVRLLLLLCVWVLSMEKTHALVNVGSGWGERERERGGKGAGRIGIIMMFALCLDETKNFEVLCATGMHTLQYAH